MNENLEEIITIAWKSSPRDTEYYLGKYIVEVTSQLIRVMDTMNGYDEPDQQFEDFYNSLVQKEKMLQKKLNRLNRLISFLKGS